jgi:hypothetical protein
MYIARAASRGGDGSCEALGTESSSASLRFVNVAASGERIFFHAEFAGAIV